LSNVHEELCLGCEYARTPDLLDLALSLLAEKLGLNDEWLLGKSTLAQNFGVARSIGVDDGNLVLSSIGLCILFSGFFRDEGPDAVQVDDRAVELLVGFVEISHPDLAEVARVPLVEQNTVMMQTTGVTTTTGMLSVLANSTMASGNVPTLVTILLQSGGHL